MAKFFAASTKLGVWLNSQEEASFPVAGAVALADSAGVTDFDASTNSAVLADFAANYSHYAAVAGVLKKDGVSVTFAADAPARAQSYGFAPAGGVRTKADRSTTSAALVDVPDLQFHLEANTTYAFYFDGFYTAAAGTTGLGLALNGPAFSFLGAGIEIATGATLAGVSQAVGAYDAGPLGTVSGGATPSPFHVYGTITTTAAGLLKLRARSEVAGSAVTMKQGSFGTLFKVG